MALKIDIKNLPKPAKIIISFLPAVIIIILVTILVILPKNKEIKILSGKIAAQENEIAKSQTRAEKLSELVAENERLKKRLNELKEQLPEEKEVSTLLKQVSDLGIQSGLRILLWKPEQKKTHASGIVYEIPVKVELSAGYHNLGYFFSSLTKLNRIVNVSDIRLTEPKQEKGAVLLRASFTATTFSAISDEETAKAQPKEAKPGAEKKS